MMSIQCSSGCGRPASRIPATIGDETYHVVAPCAECRFGWASERADRMRAERDQAREVAERERALRGRLEERIRWAVSIMRSRGKETPMRPASWTWFAIADWLERNAVAVPERAREDR